MVTTQIVTLTMRYTVRQDTVMLTTSQVMPSMVVLVSSVYGGVLVASVYGGVLVAPMNRGILVDNSVGIS